jgi:hypothetical protein
MPLMTFSSKSSIHSLSPISKKGFGPRAHIVDENVRIRRPREQVRRAFQGRKIGRNAGELTLWEKLAQLVKRCSDPFQTAAVDHDRGASARQPFCNGSADTCRGPSNDRPAASKINNHDTSPFHCGETSM